MRRKKLQQLKNTMKKKNMKKKEKKKILFKNCKQRVPLMTTLSRGAANYFLKWPSRLH
jgi:hypothetical protein